MASDPLLDFAALVAPIPGDEPAGTPVPLVIKQKLNLARMEEERNPEDPTAAPIPRKADWPGIVKQATEMLTGSSKDLFLGIRLTEALVKLHNFAGLRDGLKLLLELVEQCWDRLHPTPEEGEGMEVRAGPFSWIGEANTGGRFPNTVRHMPVASIDGQAYCWQDWKRAQEGRGPVPESDFHKAVPVDANAVEDVAAALDALARLDKILTEQLGAEAPSLIPLQEAIEDCQRLIQKVHKQSLPAGAETAPTAAGADGQSAGAALEGRPRLPMTRAEVYDQLAQIANILAQLEPHSPIPDLLRRAVELGKKPFRLLITELVRDPNLLNELRREFGLPNTSEEPPAE